MTICSSNVGEIDYKSNFTNILQADFLAYFFAKKNRKEILLYEKSRVNPTKPCFCSFFNFAVKLECLLHMEKNIDNKVT